MLSQAEAATVPAGSAGSTRRRVGGRRARRGQRSRSQGLLDELRRCHGAQGTGVPGTFPPLASNPVVTGDANKVIGIVLNGLHGSISVSGQTYNGMMPAWKGTLSNKDVADVVTYIRGSLGSNKASAVTEAQVAGYKP